MPISREHELHHRRKGRNIGLAVVLAAFVALIFAVTVVKMERGDSLEAFDHVARPSLLPKGEAAQAEDGQ
ncbi:MAG: hypothetical protein D6832_02225 [Alphaproteobacteria bacterium]|nr:MAG: hypothetical protein D6832_02225 [Alphaproteobacteria bacterium]